MPTNYDPRNPDPKPEPKPEGSGKNYQTFSYDGITDRWNLTGRYTNVPGAPDYAAIAQAAGLQRAANPYPTIDRIEREARQFTLAQRLGLIGKAGLAEAPSLADRAAPADMEAPIAQGKIMQDGTAVPDMLGFSERYFWESNAEQLFNPVNTDDHSVVAQVDVGPYKIDPLAGPDQVSSWLLFHAPGAAQELIDMGASSKDLTNARNVYVADMAAKAAFEYANMGSPEAALQVLNALPSKTRLIAAALMHDRSEQAAIEYDRNLEQFRMEQAENRAAAEGDASNRGAKFDSTTGKVITPSVTPEGGVAIPATKSHKSLVEEERNPLSYVGSLALGVIEAMLVGYETTKHIANMRITNYRAIADGGNWGPYINEVGGPQQDWGNMSVGERIGALWNATSDGFVSQDAYNQIQSKFGERATQVGFAYYEATQSHAEDAMESFWASIAGDPEAQLIATSMLRGSNMEGDDFNGGDLFVAIAAADQGNLGNNVVNFAGLEPGTVPFSVGRDVTNVASWFLLDPLLYGGKVAKAYRLTRFGLSNVLGRHGGSVSRAILEDKAVSRAYDTFGASVEKISKASGAERDALHAAHNRQFTRREGLYFGPEHTEIALREGLYTAEDWAKYYARIDEAGRIIEGKPVSIVRSPWLKGDKARKNAGVEKQNKVTPGKDTVTPTSPAYEPAQMFGRQTVKGANRDQLMPHLSRLGAWRVNKFMEAAYGLNKWDVIADAMTRKLGVGFYTLDRESQIEQLAVALKDQKFAALLGADTSDFLAVASGGQRSWVARHIMDPLLGRPGENRKFNLGWQKKPKADEDRRVNQKGWARKRAWNSDTSWDESLDRVTQQWRRLLTALPDVRRGIATNTAEDADNIYKMAVAAGLDQQSARMLRSFWVEANEGQRQVALSGLIRTFVRASGISMVDDKAEAELLRMMSGIREGEAYAARHINRLGGVIEDIGRVAGREHARLLSEANERVNPFKAQLDDVQRHIDEAKPVSLKGEGFDLDGAVEEIGSAAGREGQADVLVLNLRRSENAGVPTYARGSADGFADGLGLDPSDVVAVWEPSDPAVAMLEAAGRPGFVYVELNGSPEAAAVFRDAIAGASQSHKFGSSVTVKSVEEYADGTYRFFINSDGTAGFAITNGDVVSVFSTPGAASGSVDEMMRLAIQNGGKTADSVDTVLPKLYKRHGFKEYQRDKWNEDYAPEGWDKQVYKDFNNGEPDYLYYRHDAAYVPGAETRAELIEQRKKLRALARKWDQENKASVPSVAEIAKNLEAEAKARGGALTMRTESGRMSDGTVGAVYPGQTSSRMWVPNFSALDEYAARTSVLNALLFNNRVGSAVTNAWVLGTLAGPRFQLRNGLEDGLMYAMTRGKLSAWVRGRRHDQAILQSQARQSEALAAKTSQYEKAIADQAAVEKGLSKGIKTEDELNAAVNKVAALAKEVQDLEKLLGKKTGKLGVVRTPVVRLAERLSWDSAGRERDTMLGRLARQLVPSTSAFERRQAALAGRDAVVDLAAKAIVRQKLAASGGRFRLFGKKMRRATSVEELTAADRQALAYELSLLRSEYGYQFKEEAAETARHLSDSSFPTTGDLPELTYIDGVIFRAVYPNTSYETSQALGKALNDGQARSFLHVLELMTDNTSITQNSMWHLPQYWEAANQAGGPNRRVMDGIIAEIIDQSKRNGDWAWLVETMRMSAANPARKPEVLVEQMLNDMVGNMTTVQGKFNQKLWSALRHEDAKGKVRFSVENDGKAITVEDLIAGVFEHPEAILVRKGEPFYVPQGKGELGTKAWEMMGRSLARFTRNPIWTGNYFEARYAYAPWERRLAEVFGKEQADRMVTNWAAERAYNITMAYVDNPAVRTNLAWQVRNLARYYRAQEDFARRMLRVTKHEPEGLWKVVLGWNATMDVGFVHEDQYGQSYFMYPLTAPAMALVNNIFDGLGFTSSKYAAAPMAFGGRVQWLSPSLDPAQWLPTASSPWSALMLQPLLRTMPVLEDFFREVEKNVFGDIAADIAMSSNADGYANEVLSTGYGLLPPFAKKLVAAYNSATRQDAPGTYGYRMTMQTMLAMGAAGQVPGPDEWRNPKVKREFLENLQMRTMEVTLFSAIFGLFAPSSPQYMPDYVSEAARAAGYENLTPAFRDMMASGNDSPESYMERYISWIGQHPKDGIFLERMYEGSDAGFVAATMDNVDWIKAHKDLWDEAPQGASLFLPDREVIGKSREAFTLMKKYNAVHWRSLSDYADSIVGAEGEYEWNLIDLQFERQVANVPQYITDENGKPVKNPEYKFWEETKKVARNIVRNKYEGIDQIKWGSGTTQPSGYDFIADQIVTATRALQGENEQARAVAELVDVFQEARAEHRKADQYRLPSDVNPDEYKAELHDRWDRTVQWWAENTGAGLSEQQKNFIIWNLTKAIPTSGSWEPVEVM